MTEKENTAAVPPAPEPGNSGTAMDKPVPAAGVEKVDALTAEEQMARFAKELKENDWGHQPC